MYPNPTSSDLTIYIENSDKFEYFNIIDINGKLIQTQNINNEFNFVSMIDFEEGMLQHFMECIGQPGQEYGCCFAWSKLETLSIRTMAAIGKPDDTDA